MRSKGIFGLRDRRNHPLKDILNRGIAQGPGWRGSVPTGAVRARRAAAARPVDASQTDSPAGSSEQRQL